MVPDCSAEIRAEAQRQLAQKVKRPEALAIFSEGMFAVARVINGIKKQAVPIPQDIRCKKRRLQFTSVLLKAPRSEVARENC